MIPALRWAAMRAILMYQKEVIDKVTRQCPQTTTFLKRKESRSGIEPRSFRLLSVLYEETHQGRQPLNSYQEAKITPNELAPLLVAPFIDEPLKTTIE